MKKSDFTTLMKSKKYYLTNLIASILIVIILGVYFILTFFKIDVIVKDGISPVIETISLAKKFEFLFIILFFSISTIKVIIGSVILIKFSKYNKNKNIKELYIFSLIDVVISILIGLFSFGVLLGFAYIFFVYCFFLVIDIPIAICLIVKSKKEINNMIDRGEVDVDEPEENDVSIY